MGGGASRRVFFPMLEMESLLRKRKSGVDETVFNGRLEKEKENKVNRFHRNEFVSLCYESNTLTLRLERSSKKKKTWG